jgi:hypothetical protein
MRLVDYSTHLGVMAGRTFDVSLATLLSDLEQHRVAVAWTYSLRGLHLADEKKTLICSLLQRAEHHALYEVALH